MSYQAILTIRNTRRHLLTHRIHYFHAGHIAYKECTENNPFYTLDDLEQAALAYPYIYKPQGQPYGGLMELTIESTDDDDDFYYWFKDCKTIHGSIEIYNSSEDDQVSQRIEFWDGWITDLGEQMCSTGTQPMIMNITISPATVRYNRDYIIQKNWYTTDIYEHAARMKNMQMAMADIDNMETISTVVTSVTKKTNIADRLADAAAKLLEREGTMDAIKNIADNKLHEAQDWVEDRVLQKLPKLFEKGWYLTDIALGDQTKSMQYYKNLQKKYLQPNPTWTFEGKSCSYIQDQGEYREDGSIIYKKESEAYKRIVYMTKFTECEEMAIIGNQSVLVLPSWANEPRESKYKPYGYSFVNANLYDAVTKKEFPLLATIHTHPTGGDMTGDAGFAKEFTPMKLMYAICTGGERDGNISYLISDDEPKVRFVDVTNRVKEANVMALVKGLMSLIDYSNSVIKSHTKTGKFLLY